MSRRDRLGVLVRVREIMEGRARAEAARRHGEQVEAQSHRDERAEHLARVPGPAGRLPPVTLHAMQLLGLDAHEQFAAASRAYEEAAERERAARHELAGATTRRKIAERLHERRTRELARIAQAAAQRTLDELSALRWRSHR